MNGSTTEKAVMEAMGSLARERLVRSAVGWSRFGRFVTTGHVGPSLLAYPCSMLCESEDSLPGDGVPGVARPFRETDLILTRLKPVQPSESVGAVWCSVSIMSGSPKSVVLGLSP